MHEVRPAPFVRVHNEKGGYRCGGRRSGGLRIAEQEARTINHARENAHLFLKFLYYKAPDNLEAHIPRKKKKNTHTPPYDL